MSVFTINSDVRLTVDPHRDARREMHQQIEDEPTYASQPTYATGSYGYRHGYDDVLHEDEL